ncbi:MAG: hypothetical protein HP491_18095 [Nitrospira sp.]|nr:hypothetical protein [Nitrospira sp.]MBH0183308.1 hypothetical protein [Nitrospira sp.]MBH0187193.1 hypothetical protein [Nitrospira sp.]
MALHSDFPASPYAPLIPEQRWFPADEALHFHDPKMAWHKHIQDIHRKCPKKFTAWLCKWM